MFAWYVGISMIRSKGTLENDIEPGTAFEDLPEDWLCPLCGVGKDEFEKVEE